MTRFVDRAEELAALDRLAVEDRPHLLVVSGRRRLGKTTLLLEFAARSGLPALYWVASKQSEAVLQRSLYETISRFLDLPLPPGTVTPSDWTAILRFLSESIQAKFGQQRILVILDEFPYAVEASAPLPSELQNAWDQWLKPHTNAFVAITGSHVGMMARLQEQQAPLYGRFTARLPVGPLPFSALAEFFPGMTAAERVGVYAIFGGVPAYLERLVPGRSIRANVERETLSATGIFRTEAFHSLQEDLRDTHSYHSILQAIGKGHHTNDDIALHSGIARTSLSKYLDRLMALGYVERRLPATVPPEQWGHSRQGRYVLADQFLRFFYRFISPNLVSVEQGLFHDLWDEIGEQMRAFVGATVFEDLCREWLRRQAIAGQLPFHPQVIGAHWSREVQVDVVAVNWRNQQILLGECKWQAGAVERGVVRSLIEDQAPRLLKDLPGGAAAWSARYAFFSRAGFTSAAQAEAQAHGALLVDLATLDRDLGS
jgi:AAA+ ATPase superfamily predicted ATPase